MKVIGRIELKFEGEECINYEYAGGTIVELTQKETATITLLQEAIAGETSWDIQRYMTIDNPNDKPMEDMFTIIRLFVEQKFKINDMRKKVNELDNFLIGIEKVEDE